MWNSVLQLMLCISVLGAKEDFKLKRQIIFEDDSSDRGNGGDGNCVRPDGQLGNCILLTTCPSLRRLRFREMRPFMCGFEGQIPKVCCSSVGTTRRTTPTTRRTTPTTRRTTPTSRRTTPTTRSTPPIAGWTPAPRTPLDTGSGVAPSFLPAQCGAIKFPLRRIVGGTEAAFGSWPWMAAIFFKESNGKMSADCGGSLVTNQHVVTAAHCVVTGRFNNPVDPTTLVVRLGEHDLDSDNDGMQPVDMNVISIKPHEEFNRRTYLNDIAILKLERPVVFTTNISAICLPYQLENYDLENKTIYVTGWGTMTYNGQASPVLMQAGIEIFNQDTCRTAYRNEVPITDHYMCAGVADGSMDSCQGDSGGPLNVVGPDGRNGTRMYLLGIVSFGKRCGEQNYPGVYTKVTKYLDWLTENLRN